MQKMHKLVINYVLYGVFRGVDELKIKGQRAFFGNTASPTRRHLAKANLRKDDSEPLEFRIDRGAERKYLFLAEPVKKGCERFSFQVGIVGVLYRKKDKPAVDARLIFRTAQDRKLKLSAEYAKALAVLISALGHALSSAFAGVESAYYKVRLRSHKILDGANGYGAACRDRDLSVGLYPKIYVFYGFSDELVMQSPSVKNYRSY